MFFLNLNTPALNRNHALVITTIAPAAMTPNVEFIPKILISHGERSIQMPATRFKIIAEK